VRRSGPTYRPQIANGGRRELRPQPDDNDRASDVDHTGVDHNHIHHGGVDHYHGKSHDDYQHATAPTDGFLSSVDTMKESMLGITDGCSCLSAAQIADDVNLSAQVSPAYIRVDTHMDYPAYALKWANAVHAAGRHVWFRSHPNSWEGSNGTSAILTPAAYLTFENNWILGNPGLFKSGDILDANPEAENNRYWVNTYGPNWSWQGAPDAATDAFNNFLVAVKTTADTALAQLGITGVDTSIRSVNEWFGQNPTALNHSTITALGHLTIDSYQTRTRRSCYRRQRLADGPQHGPRRPSRRQNRYRRDGLQQRHQCDRQPAG
jgi:hypothetical protein